MKANTSDFDGPVAWIVRVRGTRATKAPRKLRDVTLMLHAFAEAGTLTLSGRGDKVRGPRAPLWRQRSNGRRCSCCAMAVAGGGG